MEQGMKERLSNEWVTLKVKRQIILIREVSRYISSGPPDFLISRAAICQMDEFRTILDAPADVEVASADFAEPISRLARLSETWQRSAAQSLLTICLPTSVTSSKGNSVVPRRELATTIFYCILPGCSRLIAYPNVSTHRCMTNPPPVPSNSKSRESLEDLVALFVRQCDLDPEVTTAARMDALDPRFICFECSSPEGVMIFSWRTAV